MPRDSCCHSHNTYLKYQTNTNYKYLCTQIHNVYTHRQPFWCSIPWKFIKHSPVPLLPTGLVRRSCSTRPLGEVTGVPPSDIFSFPNVIPTIWPSMEVFFIGLALFQHCDLLYNATWFYIEYVLNIFQF